MKRPSIFHIHRDPNWFEEGVWRYFTCRCGARRVCKAMFFGYTPVRQNWYNLLVDKHNRFRNNSGWQYA